MENNSLSPDVAPSMTQKEFHSREDTYNIHDASFRRHYQLTYAGGPHDYESYYAPAYRYGYELSEESAGAVWDQVAQDAKQHWTSNSSTPWADIVDAIQYGWTEQRHPEKLRVHHSQQFEDYQPAFQQHFLDHYPDTEESFDHYVPLYNYGYTLAIDPDYNLSPWNDVEPDVRSMWEQEYHSRFMWEDYRDAVRHAWEEVRARAENS